ncbi:MAG: radical SAM protein [Thermotogae bacterium]|nr:radical SAM protein [Thermotogota bacterium]
MGERSYPSYLALYESGELAERVERARELSERCVLCPRACLVRRTRDEVGECGVGRYALVSSYGPHFGEESVLRGWRGSGTVFFAGCNMRCVYCQNYEISQLRLGREVSPREMAEIFLEVQRMGCHNLNLVTPSHVVWQILEALLLAVERGFRLPIVYNTSSYDSLQSLKLLDGVVDIYMPDLKYSDSKVAERYSGVRGYWEVARKAVKEMHRQVGVLELDERGLARRGLLIRHLVLPNGIAGSKEVMRFIAEELSRDSWVNVMDQYRPEYRAWEFPELARPITRREYWEVVEYARSLGIHRGIPFSHTS